MPIKAVRIKLANPLYYPAAVLLAAVILIGGVRVLRLPAWLMLPVSGAIATLGASILRAREPDFLNLGNPVLEQELLQVQAQAQGLAERAEVLRVEATRRLLTEMHQVELLGAVQYACDRTQELPSKIARLAQRLQGTDSLLSMAELEQQLAVVESQLETSTGAAQQSHQQLADSLRRNIELARQGQDARQAQVISLSTQILDAAGVLQSLQNKLCTADLTNAKDTGELQLLSEDFKELQKNVDVLVMR